MVAWGWRRGVGSHCLMSPGFPFGVMIMSWNQTEVVFLQHCECTKCCWIVHFEMVILCYVTLTSIKNRENTHGVITMQTPRVLTRLVLTSPRDRTDYRRRNHALEFASHACLSSGSNGTRRHPDFTASLTTSRLWLELFLRWHGTSLFPSQGLGLTR